MATNEETNAAGTDTRPPMLVENDYESWKIRIHRSILISKPTSLMPKRLSNKQEQSTSYCDHLANGAHNHTAPALSSPPTPTVSHLPTTTPDFLNSRTHADGADVTLLLEPVKEGSRGEGHVARQCKEPKRKMDSQYFKDKALLMEAKEKGDVLDAEAEAFLADTVDEGPNAAVAFMANLSSTSATNNPVNEVHSNDNQIFDNVDYQLSQEMHQEEHLDSDAETEIDDNTIPYHQYLLDTEAQNVPTEVSADTSDKKSLKDTLPILRIQLDGLKVENVSLKRRYDELSKANTHSRTAYTENTKLKAQVTGTTSSGPSTSETPKVLAPGMYNLGVKPTSGASKTVPKRAPRNHSSLPAKSANARRVEAHHRTLNKRNRVDSNLLVKHSVSVSNLNNVCDACNKSLVFATHNDCLVMCDDSMNVKPHQTKRLKRQPKKEWKPIKNVGKPIKRVWKPITKPVANSNPRWKPTGRHFSLFEKQYKLSKVSGFKDGSRHKTAIVGYVDYKRGDTFISRVYYVEGLKHNLFSVGQFCDGGLEVAFRQHSCYIRNSDMVDLLKGSRTTNLYSISLNDMMSASPVCLLTKASSTKSWLWHRRLNHLNFGTLNELARNNLVRGLPMLKYDKDHLCPSCQLGKSKKASHPLKAENTNTEVLHTLHMDLCGPMRTESINGKKYVLVIVDDFTRFGWVRFLRTKDETPQVVEKFIVKTQRALNATVRFVRTDNGTEFVNKTLDGWFESVGISHETSVPRSPQQNGVVERRNRTLMEAARTMLIFAKAPLFLWAEAVATACYTLNRSLVLNASRKTY
ncbi:retrovirus-related pol polyprotein from transposon TNT 1-94 [Tanacetum coccineum]